MVLGCRPRVPTFQSATAILTISLCCPKTCTYKLQTSKLHFPFHVRVRLSALPRLRPIRQGSTLRLLLDLALPTYLASYLVLALVPLSFALPCRTYHSYTRLRPFALSSRARNQTTLGSNKATRHYLTFLAHTATPFAFRRYRPTRATAGPPRGNKARPGPHLQSRS